MKGDAYIYITSSKVSPLALRRTRKELIKASLQSLSKKSSDPSASSSLKSSLFTRHSINCQKKKKKTKNSKFNKENKWKENLHSCSSPLSLTHTNTQKRESPLWGRRWVAEGRGGENKSWSMIWRRMKWCFESEECNCISWIWDYQMGKKKQLQFYRTKPLLYY